MKDTLILCNEFTIGLVFRRNWIDWLSTVTNQTVEK